MLDIHFGISRQPSSTLRTNFWLDCRLTPFVVFFDVGIDEELKPYADLDVMAVDTFKLTSISSD